jgi:hypothetical protein
MLERTDLPNIGPFKWFDDLLDPEFHYGKLYHHFRDQGKIIDYWKLPGGEGPIVNTVNRDGVMIMRTAAGNFLFIQENDVVQGDLIFHDRYVTLLSLDGLVTSEEQAEINVEQALIRQNIAFVEHHKVIEKLRGYCVKEPTERYLIATQALSIPGLTRKQVLEECRHLREARLEIARLERYGEERLLALVRAMLLGDCQERLEHTMTQGPYGAILLPRGGKVVLVDDDGKSQEATRQDLDQTIGQLYRSITRRSTY